MFWHEDALKIRHIWMDWTHSPDSHWRAAKKMAKRPLRSAQGLMGKLLFYHTLPDKGWKLRLGVEMTVAQTANELN